MPNNILKDGEGKMKNAISNFSKELASIRAGRANPSLLESIQIDYYGAPTPLNQLAGISVPEARMLLIQPYDKGSIEDIERAILKSDLGLTPSNDGNVLRLTIPALTEERRTELARVVKKYAEEGKIAIRNIRRDMNDELRELEKSGNITEDELRRYTGDVQTVTDKYIEEVDNVAAEKEKEIMEV